MKTARRVFTACPSTDQETPRRLAPLVLAAGLVAVGATLTCGAAVATATATRYSTIGGFALDAAGNFSIRGPLGTDGVNTAVRPETCTHPVLLIRSVNTTTPLPGGWFAAGIPSSGDDD